MNKFISPNISVLGIGTDKGKMSISEEVICEMANKEANYLGLRTRLSKVFYMDHYTQTMDQIFINAIDQALDKSKLKVGDLDGIFLSNSGSHEDKIIPYSSMLAAGLGINKKPGLVVKDINTACSGFGDALDTAYKQICHDTWTGKIRNYLVISGDNLGSGQRDFDDINTGMFSDGAGAMVISNNPELSGSLSLLNTGSSITTHVSSDTIRAINQPDGCKMNMENGRALTKFLLPTADEIFALLEIDYLDSGTLIIPHQPNASMLDSWEKKSRIIKTARDAGLKEIDVHKSTFETMGNLSGASVVFALQNEIEAGKLNQYDKVIMMPFGAGGNISGAQLQVNKL